MEKNNKEIAEAWIALQYAERDSDSYEANFWSFMMLDEFRDNEPQRCWEVIEEIFRSDDSDFLLSNLAAGPLENLLIDSGDVFINRIEELARRKARFKIMLGMVWKNNIPEDIWERIQRASR